MSGDLITCLAAFACIAVLTVPLVDGFCMRRGSGGPFLPLRWMPRCDCKVGNRNRGAVAEAMRLRGGSWEFRAIIPMRNRGHGHDREPRSLQPPPRSEAEPRPRTNLYPSYNNNAEATRLQASWNLLTSCSRADLGAVKSLVTAGAIDFDVRDSLGRTPLHIAACLDRGGEDIAMAILDCAEGRLLLHAYDNRGMCPIHVAASSENAGVLEILLGDMNQGVLTGQRRNREIKDAIAIRDKHGRTAMHHAAAQVGAECVRMLLSCKEGESLVNETDTLGLSALHYAASSMVSERISEMLIDAGASLDARDVEGKTSLMMACGDVPPAPTERIHRTVLLLAACGGRDLTMAVDRFGANCMLHAAAENKSDIVRLLLRLPEGAELARTADYVGQTPLLKACKYGHAEVVKVLLEEEAGGLELVEAWDNQGNTALQLAIYYEDIVALLLERGEREARMRMLTRRDIIGQNCFHRAFACNAVESLRRLLDADRETGSRLMVEQDVDGFGVLHHAAFGGNDEVIRMVQRDFLAEAGPSEESMGQQLLMQRDSFGRTSLHLAASRGYFEVVLALLAMHGDMDGPLIDSLDDNNFSVLHHAASMGSANTVDLLLQGERGRRLVLHKGRFGVIALHQASGYGHSSVVSMLLQVGEGMDHIMVQDEKGMTALHHACFGGSQATVEALLYHAKEAGGEGDEGVMRLALMKDMYGCSGLHYAAACGQADVVTMMLSLREGYKLQSVVDEDGLTPMMFAARFGRYRALKALIEGQGSRQVLRMTDKRNVSCMGHAAASRNQECVSLLMTDWNVGGLEMLHVAMPRCPLTLSFQPLPHGVHAVISKVGCQSSFTASTQVAHSA